MTPQRRARLAQLWPDFVRLDQIVAELSALPGPALSRNRAYLGTVARKMGLRRPAGYGAWHRRLVAQEKAALKPPKEPRVSAPRGGMTPERKALLIELWPQFRTAADIMGALNALPGPKLSEDSNYLPVVAKTLGVRRPDGFREWLRARNKPAQAAAPARAASVPAPDTGAPLPPVPATLARIRRWGAEHGLKEDAGVAVVNRKRVALGKPPFIQVPSSGRLTSGVLP